MTLASGLEEDEKQVSTLPLDRASSITWTRDSSIFSPHSGS